MASRPSLVLDVRSTMLPAEAVADAPRVARLHGATLHSVVAFAPTAAVTAAAACGVAAAAARADTVCVGGDAARHRLQLELAAARGRRRR